MGIGTIVLFVVDGTQIQVGLQLTSGYVAQRTPPLSPFLLWFLQILYFKALDFSDFIAIFAMSVGFDTYFDLQH